MKQLWMLVGVAVVAGTMYVAAAPGSRQATAPTARQFAALKKQVASLNKKLTALTKDEKAVKTAAVAAVEYIGACFLDSNGNIENLQVNDFGDTTTGFLFGTSGSGTSTSRSALDVNVAGTTPLAYLQEVTPACVTGAAAASPAQSSIARVDRWAKGAR
jgi:hypothetical protein